MEGRRKKKREESDERQWREDPGEKRRAHYLEGVNNINPCDYDLLRNFVTTHGKIMPSRFTGATAKQQRQIKRAIRRARVMGLVP